MNTRDETIMQFQIIPCRNTSIPDFPYLSTLRIQSYSSLAIKLHSLFKSNQSPQQHLHTPSSFRLDIFIESLLISSLNHPGNAWHTTGVFQMFVVCRNEWTKEQADPKPSHLSGSCPSLHFSMTTYCKLWTTALTPWPDWTLLAAAELATKY